MSIPLLPQRGSRLYIEGLPSSLDDETLTMYFSQYGSLEECKIIKDKDISKRYGFVSYSCPSVSHKVASIIHTIQGSRIHVERLDLDHKDNFEYSLPSKRLFVSLLGLEDINADVLRTHFSNSGQIKSILIEKGMDDKILYAIVTFESDKSVEDAVESAHILHGKALIVRKALRSEEVKKARQVDRERSAREERTRMNTNQSSQPYHSSIHSVSNTYFPYGYQ